MAKQDNKKKRGKGKKNRIAFQKAKKTLKKAKNAAQKSLKEAKTESVIKVPEGYENSGTPVSVDHVGLAAHETKTTLGITGEKIRIGVQTTIQDLGFSKPVNIGDRIIDFGQAEFMRARDIEFTATGLLPNTNFYAFFDGVNVTEFCKRTGDNNFATASGIASDSRGQITGIFSLPNDIDSGIRFKTGTKKFRLTTSPTNESFPAPASFADADYTATGWISEKQETTFSTRLFNNNVTSVTEDLGAITKNSSFSEFDRVCPEDPIAQSFYVREPSGVFLTSVDVFFYRKPVLGENINGRTTTEADLKPIDIEIRPLSEGGLPSNKIIPFGKLTLEHDEVVTNQIDLTQGTLTVYGIEPITLVGTFSNDGNKVTGIGSSFTTQLNVGDKIRDPLTNNKLIVSRIESDTVLYTQGEFDPPLSGELTTGGVVGETYGPWNTTSKVKNNSGLTIESGVPVNLSSDPANDMIPTRFTFKSPVYLAGLTSYAFVLKSDCDLYKVWISEFGPDLQEKIEEERFRESGEPNVEIGTTIPIQKDPYIGGSYFKSQSGITWTEDQTKDIKFKLWKAKFDTSINAQIDFVNENLPTKNLTLDPFTTLSGSSLVRVFHRNHGMTPETNVLPGSIVVFSGVEGAGGDVNGFSEAIMNREEGHIIVHVEMDAYIIDVRTDPYDTSPGAKILATSSGKTGGPNVTATENVRYEELQLLTSPLILPETTVTWNLAPTGSAGPNDFFNTPYELFIDKEINIEPNEINTFTRPMQISSGPNERNITQTPAGPSMNTDFTTLGASKSCRIRAVLSSENENLSPIIDMDRFSVVCTSNRIDAPAGNIPADSEVRSEQVINHDFDNFSVLPSTDAPALTAGDIADKIFFSSSTGIIATDANSTGTTVTASTANFLRDIEIGSIIKNSATGEENVVVSITDENTLTVEREFATSLSNDILLADPPALSIKTPDAEVATHLSKIDIGKLVTLTGATGDRNFTDAYVLSNIYTPFNTIADPDYNGHPTYDDQPTLCEIEIDYRPTQAEGFESSTNLSLVQKDRFVDEIAPVGGSCSAKHISKILTLARPSNTLKIQFDANRHESNILDVYYRLQLVDEVDKMENIGWTLAEFNIEVGDNLIPGLPIPNDDPEEYSAYEVNLHQLPRFIGVQIKIVMFGGNPARFPKIQNLKVIALEE